jgi:hypothetical protein
MRSSPGDGLSWTRSTERAYSARVIIDVNGGIPNSFAEAIGRPLEFSGSPHPQEYLPDVQAVGPVEKYITIAMRKDDTPIEISLAACPIRDVAGDIASVVYTARRTAAERLEPVLQM